MSEIILDITRLLSRVLHPTPTGVDRVEMAYARGLLAEVPDRLRFAAVHPSGMYGRLPTKAVRRFLDVTEQRWRDEGLGQASLRLFAAKALLSLRPRLAKASAKSIYLQPSPNNLIRPALMRAILKRENARLVCLVHDLIPIQFPEYARPGGAALHERRMATVAALSDGVIANSQATLDALQPTLDRAGRNPRTAVAYLGAEFAQPTFEPASDRPYFICVGTIEPRKNHLLLLHLWRAMAERRGAHAVPKLVLVGRRGWENEQVVDMLERCPVLADCVEEHAGLPDREVQGRIAAARGLLLPSFAEGYGMPVAEALALGVPVVCSDLPALREAGGDVPLFLDPLDGPGWQRAIDDLTATDSAERRAQIDRLGNWHAPTWPQHIAIVLDLLHKLER
ncbi:glycosyltransferase family 4 protein [Sphingomonas crusticola]|uniref:glycosyltransferase family 4 protein n=1 Tax=Sphingomonas crusticola TaxID=1697973 RepID=UPI001F077EDD|nr:glycosyltransferase family 1 protein [Sphingomonas crusticola]